MNYVLSFAEEGLRGENVVPVVVGGGLLPCDPWCTMPRERCDECPAYVFPSFLHLEKWCQLLYCIDYQLCFCYFSIENAVNVRVCLLI